MGEGGRRGVGGVSKEDRFTFMFRNIKSSSECMFLLHVRSTAIHVHSEFIVKDARRSHPDSVGLL
jgi:hypothetical protein